MNLTGPLEYVALSTVTRINDARDLSEAEVDSPTAIIEAAIAEVSSAACEYLGMHTKRATRTEVYEMRQFSRTLSLDATNVDTTDFVLAIGDDPLDAAGATPLTKGRDYSLNASAGTVRLLSTQASSPAYVQVSYTGGLFAAVEDIGSAHVWLTSAVETQILYRIQRRDTLGGNVSQAPGGSTQFSGSYNWLPLVRDALRSRRRITM